MTAMAGYRELRVWQAAMDLVEGVYRHTQTFPKQEVYGLAAQLQRAAVSIPANVAEGHVRDHLKEYLRHISVAQGSLAELETQLEIARRLGYVERAAHRELLEQTASIGKQLYALRNSLGKKLNTESTAHVEPSWP